jgi:riboflavin synthase
MFTGIIESIGKVKNITQSETNLDFTISCDFLHEITIDQSIAHNGVCLTVVALHENSYTVTAIEETLNKSNLGWAKIDDKINLERAMKLGDRLDGHLVQGHVDQIGEVFSIQQENGSWIYTIQHQETENITVEKGSICVNGTSLTVVNSKKGQFSVALIPYTYDFTNFNTLSVGDKVNLEFDILGKYISKLIARNGVS